MLCEMCGLDLQFYGATSRHIEGLNICIGCYLDVKGSGFGAPDYREHVLEFVGHERHDTRCPFFIAAA